MEKEREIFWFYLDEAETKEEIPVMVRKVSGRTDEDGEIQNMVCLELPVSGAVDFPVSEEILTAGPGLDGMIWIYLPDQWKEMCSFLRQNEEKNPKEWRAAIRYFLAAAVETEVKDGKLYLPEYLLRKCGIEEKAVLLRYEKDGQPYYAVQKEKRPEETGA